MTKSDKAERYPGLKPVLILALGYLPLAWYLKNQSSVVIAGMMYSCLIIGAQPKWNLLTWLVAVMGLIACTFVANADWSRFAVGLSVMFLGLPLRRLYPPDES